MCTPLQTHTRQVIHVQYILPVRVVILLSNDVQLFFHVGASDAERCAQLRETFRRESSSETIDDVGRLPRQLALKEIHE